MFDKRTHDARGREFGKEYSLILTDPSFENRLKQFDPNLKLMFDQEARRWRILEWAPDNSGWNVVITAEDDDKNPKPLGEWVFNTLYVYRHNYELRRKNPNEYFDSLLYEEERQKNEIETRSSVEHIHQLMDERNEWRRGFRELRNLPTSDVSAGYRKITPKPKGIIHAIK